jgi:hypothetical protein
MNSIFDSYIEFNSDTSAMSLIKTTNNKLFLITEEYDLDEGYRIINLYYFRKSKLEELFKDNLDSAKFNLSLVQDLNENYHGRVINSCSRWPKDKIPEFQDMFPDRIKHDREIIQWSTTYYLDLKSTGKLRLFLENDKNSPPLYQSINCKEQNGINNTLWVSDILSKMNIKIPSDQDPDFFNSSNDIQDSSSSRINTQRFSSDNFNRFFWNNLEKEINKNFITAIITDNLELFQKTIEEGADINLKINTDQSKEIHQIISENQPIDFTKFSVLMLATYFRKNDMVEYLINKGVNLNYSYSLKNRQELTSMDIAIVQDNIALVDLFYNHDARHCFPIYNQTSIDNIFFKNLISENNYNDVDKESIWCCFGCKLM